MFRHKHFDFWDGPGMPLQKTSDYKCHTSNMSVQNLKKSFRKVLYKIIKPTMYQFLGPKGIQEA